MAALADAPRGRWWADRAGRAAGVGVLAVAGVAWGYVLAGPPMRMPGMAGAMTAMAGAGSAMPGGGGMGWSWPDLAAFTAAWAVMMAAMMLPSAAPMISLFSTVSRHRESGRQSVRTVGFVAPYALLWTLTAVPVYAFSVSVASLVRDNHWAHDGAPYAVAGVLLAAGLYQFSPLKRACLASCRNPLRFLADRWRNGLLGAAQLGGRHAAYCVGCCAGLMVVLVAAGAMGTAWVLLIAAVVLVEKVAPRRLAATSVTGVLLLGLGAAVALSPGLAGSLRA